MNWYDNIKYDIPESLDAIKKESMSKVPLIEHKKMLHKRLVDASRFFSNPGLSSNQILEGNKLLIQIVADMISIDEEIMSKDINVIGAYEAKSLGLDIKARIGHHTNDLDEAIDGINVQFSSLDSNQDNNCVQIGLEDTWYFKSIKKLFDININNIEIL